VGPPSETSIGTYHLHVTWDAATNATSYQASISRSGTTVASTKVADTNWDVNVAGTPGQKLTVQVRGLRTHFKGKWASTTTTFTDQIAPIGTFSAKSDDPNPDDATITQVSLVDDSNLSDVTRTVDWADGSTDTWTPGDTTITHPYNAGTAQVRYAATVTMKDLAGNTRTVEVIPAPVFNDHTAPTGAFSASPASAWAKLTKVKVTQKSLSDGAGTPSQYITRSVNWKDGTTSVWTKGTTLTHVYTKGGRFTPKVTITDEAGNSATLSTSVVVVKVDKTSPKVTVAISRPKHSVKAWRKLHGKATDHGTGVKRVWVKVVEKRKGHWYGYNAATHRWVKAASKARALARSKAISRKTNSQHQWTAKVPGLRKGKLVVRAWAADRVGHRSATVIRKASLTRR